MSRRMIAVNVGVLFFVQMVTAVVGTSLIQAFVDGDPEMVPLTVGVLLMTCSGATVVGIGFLMYPILKAVNQRLAIWYPTLRIVELAVSAAFGPVSPDSVAGGSEPPTVDLHSNRYWRLDPHLLALRFKVGSSTNRIAWAF